MPGIFNPLSFFRHAPSTLLEQFFSSVPAFEGFDWSAVSKRRVEAIYERCNLIPPRGVRQDLQRLSDGRISGHSHRHAGSARGRPRH